MADAEEFRADENDRKLPPFDEHDLDKEDDFFDYFKTMELIAGGIVGVVGITVAAYVVYKFRNRHIDFT